MTTLAEKTELLPRRFFEGSEREGETQILGDLPKMLESEEFVAVPKKAWNDIIAKLKEDAGSSGTSRGAEDEDRIKSPRSENATET